MAILHYPVYNKNREIIATCVSSYDIHDISRTARCYGVKRFYVVNPMETQQDLARSISMHWLEGYGAHYNPTRKEALKTLKIVTDLAAAIADISAQAGTRPKLVVTSSRPHDVAISYEHLQQLMALQSETFLILFGTGWGLSSDIIKQADYYLEPIMDKSDYNHLSVRSASAVILDRLLGNRNNGGRENA
ncbi:RNA methyltransferase [candidate division CSSED10-310 bacterium]|uniref:RNA methyltransferase n=1 Tax=candidate division CSSED10-310 bacterium TaxID=2855610 RepID=A0ABV6YZ65_UNCC1